MNDVKYIGLDVHQATISATVLDSAGKQLMESILETKAATILQLFTDSAEAYRSPSKKHLRALAARFAEAACEPSGGVRST
jgi:hypothetical protein